MICPYKQDCKYANSGKCNDERYTECQLVEYDLIDELIQKKWRL